jgi:hypothetical protein
MCRTIEASEKRMNLYKVVTMYRSEISTLRRGEGRIIGANLLVRKKNGNTGKILHTGVLNGKIITRHRQN